MTQAGHVLLYAVAAAASPLVLAATFVVLRSERPRGNGIAFLSGLLLGTCVACGLGLVLGNAAVERIDSHGTIEGVLTLLLGLVLLLIGLRARHSAPRPETEGSGRASAILAGLGNVRPAAAFSMAGLLGLGGPKRLVFTFLAMASISEAGIGGAADITLIVTYIVIATALVWVPVGNRGRRGRARRRDPRARPILADQPRRGLAGLALARDRCCAGRGRARSCVQVDVDAEPVPARRLFA